MAGKEEQEPRLFKWGALILGFVAVVLVGEAVVVYWSLGDWGKSGTFGDTFGAANALFSGLAFGGVIVAILLQRKELELQRKELELTRKELARTAEAQEKSEKIFQQQLYFSFLASKIEALNTSLTYYSREYNRPGRLPSARDADGKKMAQCKQEIDEVITIFRNAKLDG